MILIKWQYKDIRHFLVVSSYLPFLILPYSPSKKKKKNETQKT